MAARRLRAERIPARLAELTGSRRCGALLLPFLASARDGRSPLPALELPGHVAAGEQQGGTAAMAGRPDPETRRGSSERTFLPTGCTSLLPLRARVP